MESSTINYQFLISKGTGPMEALQGLQDKLNEIMPDTAARGMLVEIVSNTMTQVTMPTRQLTMNGQTQIEVYFLAVIILKITDYQHVLIGNDIAANGMGSDMLEPEVTNDN